jgi:hypothetical protein
MGSGAGFESVITTSDPGGVAALFAVRSLRIVWRVPEAARVATG